MSIHPVSSPDPEPLGGDGQPSIDLEPLLEAWAQVLKADARAGELRSVVESLRTRLDRRARQLTLVAQVARLLSSDLKTDRLAALILESLQDSLGARAGLVWALDRTGFTAQAGLGLHRRQLEALRLPAPQPFPGYPVLLYQPQWLEPAALPAAVRGVLALNLRPGEGCFFFPFEHQMLLVGFALLALPEGQSAEATRAEALEIIARLFADTLQNHWLVQDLEAQRQDLRLQAAELEARSQALSRQNLALREGETIRAEFLAFAAQELRHQLAGALAPLARLREVVRGREEAADLLEGLLAGKHMAELLADLLQLAKPPGAGPGCGALPVDPGPLLAELWELVRALPRRGGGALSWPDTSELPEVLADRERLKQVLLSLCTAALRHSPDGSLALWIEREPLALTFRLRLPALDLRPVAALLGAKGFVGAPRLAPLQGGAGLGLVISRQLLLGMGGSLRLEPDPTGAGGVVGVELALA